MKSAVPVRTGNTRNHVRTVSEVDASGRAKTRIILDVAWGMKLAARHPRIAASVDAARDGGGP